MLSCASQARVVSDQNVIWIKGEDEKAKTSAPWSERA